MTHSCWRERAIPPLGVASCSSQPYGRSTLGLFLHYTKIYIYISKKSMQLLYSSPVLRKICAILQGYVSIRGK